MKIDSLDRDLQQILTSNFYKVPRFQRPYSWEKDNVSDFWQDAIVDSESDYFIGSIVVYKIKDSFLGIVDGQQRLTTITMILCALRNTFRDQGFDDLATGLHGLIERKDINNKPQFVFQTETSYPYLQEHIQKDGKPDTNVKVGDEEENLRTAFEYITQNLNDTVSSINRDATSSDEAKKVSIKNKLTEIRDKILKLKVIFINLDNEDDAYTIFETLNTRGKDLNLSDLVKGHITKLIKPKNVNVDLTKDKWNQIVKIIEESSADLTVDGFLHHYWLSKYEYLPAKKLYKAIKKRVRESQEAQEFLDSLLADAHTYRGINETLYRKWDKQELSIRRSLDALNLFRVKQPLPMLLAIMHEYRVGNLKKKHVQDVLGAIENFHFVFTAVTSQRSSGGIAQMYALHARTLIAATTLQSKIRPLDELTEKLKSRRPGYQEFEARFNEIRYSDSFVKQKKLVQYILGGIASHDTHGMPLDYDLLTIEHISAQNAADKVSAAHCAQLGNLILIDHELNNKLGNKSFSEKKKILLESNVPLDSVIQNSDTWGEKQIEDRTKLLSKTAYEDVWRL
jgi:uncharacterized protein with ParB-like and HNH nuclease domain